MKTLKEEMLEVLEDTVQFYSKDPSKRGIISNTTFCQFVTPENNKCAVGRYFNKKDLDYLVVNDLVDRDIESLGRENLSTEIIKRLPLLFWKDLQDFHDTAKNWNAKTISYSGKRKAKYIKNKILKGKYK